MRNEKQHGTTANCACKCCIISKFYTLTSHGKSNPSPSITSVSCGPRTIVGGANTLSIAAGASRLPAILCAEHIYEPASDACTSDIIKLPESTIDKLCVLEMDEKKKRRRRRRMRKCHVCEPFIYWPLNRFKFASATICKQKCRSDLQELNVFRLLCHDMAFFQFFFFILLFLARFSNYIYIIYICV